VTRELTIAIDGPSSSGKGTVARTVARDLSYQYIDTGAMYRAVALFSRRYDVLWDDEPGVSAVARSLEFRFGWDGDVLRILVNDLDVTAEIRQGDVGQGASKVSALPLVRSALLQVQRDLADRGGVVMDGRDIGTVVLPDADLKIYLDAELDERARRRHEEVLRRGDVVSYDDVRASLAERDHRDMNRDVAPLCQADDAVYVDSTDLTIRQAARRVGALVDALRPDQKGVGLP
jgi:cytidylate kinase